MSTETTQHTPIRRGIPGGTRCDGCEDTWAEHQRQINSHAALVEALEAAFATWFEKPSNIEELEPKWVSKARAALRLARGDSA